MSDEKYDLEKGLKAMRYVAKMLNTWADDLEASGRSGCENGADGQSDAVGMTPERREALEKVLDEAVGANETEPAAAESAPAAPAVPAAAPSAVPAVAPEAVPASAADAAPVIPAAPAAPVAPAATAVPVNPATPAPTSEPIKFEQVQHAMTVLCATSLRPRVEALVLSYGVCLSVIPKEKYAELMAAAEEMAKEAGIDLFGGDGHG